MIDVSGSTQVYLATGVTDRGPHDVKRFIKRTSVTKDGEEAVDYYEIDQSVIDEEEKYDGFYAVATNLDDDAKDVLNINSKRYKIEDCFRILKTNFSARPVYHSKKNRIIAHFMICYTALLIYRLLECKLDQYGTHFTTDNILDNGYIISACLKDAKTKLNNRIIEMPEDSLLELVLSTLI